MPKDINLSLMAEEYANYPFEVGNIILFTRDLKEVFQKYQTLYSAFIFTVEGRAEITLDDEVFIAEEGKVIHACANKSISFKPLDNKEYTHINVYYRPFKTEHRRSNYMNSAFEVSIGDNENIKKHLKKLLIISNRPEAQSRFRKKAIFLSIIDEIFACLLCRSKNSERDMVQESVEYMINNYKEPITLKSLSERFGKSEQQFSYIFYKHMGIRPINYLIEHRMEMAMQFLTVESLSVKETAERVGYQDPFYFSRLFKKHMGKSPRDIKKLF